MYECKHHTWPQTVLLLSFVVVGLGRRLLKAQTAGSNPAGGTCMNKYLRILFFIITCINIFLASWFVRQGDVMFSPDIGRDFFILDEIRQKTIVLIGPRSSAPGFFHGVF